MTKADGDAGGFGGEALAGTQIKGHPPPAPVVDVKFGGDIGFGDRIDLDTRLVLVAGNVFIMDNAGPYCARMA